MKGNPALEQTKNWQQKYLPGIFCGLSFVFVFLTLLLLYKVPYNGDDAINCMTLGALRYNDTTVWSHTLKLFEMWLGNGRFYPLAFYSYGMFSALTTLFAYRTFQIVLNMMVVAAFAGLTHKLTKSMLATNAAILLIPVFFQYRVYHDPILAYHGMLQLVALYLVGAIFFQVHAIEKNRIWPLIISALLYACCILTYEISFSFIVLFVVVAIYYKKGRQRLNYMLPHLVVTVIILAITFYIRLIVASSSYGGTTMSWDFVKIINTYKYQLLAAVPLSYWPWNRSAFAVQLKQLWSMISVWDIFLTGAFATLLLTNFFVLPRKKLPSILLYCGLGLWLLPATIIALSERYQNELTLGIGYLPVYIEYLGGVFIALFLLSLIFSHIRKIHVIRILAVVFTLCFTLAFLMTNLSNRMVQQTFARDHSQSVASAAMGSGILSELKDGDSFMAVGGGVGVSFEPSSFVCLYSDGLRVQPIKMKDLIDQKTIKTLKRQKAKADKKSIKESKKTGLEAVTASPVTTLTPPNLYAFNAIRGLPSGLAAVAKVDALDYNFETKEIVQVYTHEVKIYVTDKGLGELTIEQLDKNNGIKSTVITVDEISESPMEQTRAIAPKSLDNPSNLIINRLSPVHKIGNFEQIFALDQGAHCLLKITSSHDPILFMNLRIVEIPK